MNGKSFPQVTSTQYKPAASSLIDFAERVELPLMLCMVGYLYFLGNINLPIAHDYIDGTDVRDTGTMLSYLLSQPNPLIALLKAVFGHIEGPLQYLILNTYCYIIGDLLPLTPSTMALPNIVCSAVAIVFLRLIVRRIASRRAAFYCVAVFALGPWLAITIRQPWYFNSLSCSLHCATLYFWLRLAQIPNEKSYQAPAFISLGLYLLTGMDWPLFLCFLMTFLYRASIQSDTDDKGGSLKITRVSLFLLACAAPFLIVTTYWCFKHGTVGLVWSRVGHPFSVFIECVGANSLSRMWNNTLLPWGPQALLAFAGVLLFYGRAWRIAPGSNRTLNGLLESMCLWLTLSAAAVFVSSGHPTYLYVLAVPSAILGGLTLSRISDRYAIAFLAIMAVTQFHVVINGDWSLEFDKKKRTLAAACFLIEQRPDLISGDAVPFVAAGNARAVTSYMRAGVWSIPIYSACPTENSSSFTEEGSLLDGLRKLHGESDEMGHPWFIMDTEVLNGTNPSRDFWVGLLRHPDVRWIARFRDDGGGEIAIAEFSRGGGIYYGSVPVKDASSLCASYLEKYNRINFLKKNVEFVRHY